MKKIEAELSEREYTNLLLLLGYAAGAAERDGLREFYRQFIHLANRLLENQSDFTPIELPHYAFQERDEDHERWWSQR